MTASADDRALVRKIFLAIAGTIKDVGEAPSGVLYAGLMHYGMSLETYLMIVRTLKSLGWVSESGHLLKWTGPETIPEA